MAQASSLGEYSQDGCATKKVRFEVVEADSEKGLGFDPAAFSKGGNATCPFCGTVADADYVQTQGKEKRAGAQLMAVVCTQPAAKGKTYLGADALPADYLLDEQLIRRRIDELCKKTGLTVPNEPISPSRPSPNARGLSAVTRHGLTTFGNLFTYRQMLCLLTFVAAVREAHQIMVGQANPMVGQASSLTGPGKMPGPPRSMLGQVDGPSRFYVLWRYTYKAAELDAGEAIVFTYAQPVELDGQRGLSSGSRALVEKKKAKYRLRDFTERGDDGKLGLPDLQTGTPAPLIDVLHRVLWLMENEPRALGKFIEETGPDRERLHLVAQALAGAGLKGKAEEGAKTPVTTTAAEQAALGKLLANWRTLIESSTMPLFELR
ncbi:MAG TPA: hypothetical protein VNN62_02390 [Methylomirabilota bacterium]|nr:hypothetical protein [Methylomirabilota bacterium]